MAAGLGFKTFTTGEVLTAADTNGYLMQGILVFASEAARNAAITSPQEGQFAFTKDNNSTWYYDGAAWVASGASGDVTGVTAGTGITVTNPTGPVPTVTNDMATTITASGDIVIGTGSGTYDNLPIGTTGQILTADTTVSPYKVKWATPAGGGGKVLQVVNATYNTEVTSSSTTLIDTGLSASITPSATSSKILILVSHNGVRATNHACKTALNRGGTQIFVIDTYLGYTGGNVVGVANSVNYLDSPNTTSSTTYKTQFCSQDGSPSASVQKDGAYSMITLLEIGV